MSWDIHNKINIYLFLVVLFEMNGQLYTELFDRNMVTPGLFFRLLRYPPGGH